MHPQVILSDLIAYFVFDEIQGRAQTQLFFIILAIQVRLPTCTPSACQNGLPTCLPIRDHHRMKRSIETRLATHTHMRSAHFTCVPTALLEHAQITGVLMLAVNGGS